MPRTFGDGVIHQSHLDAMVTVDDPLPELNLGKPSPEEDRIGQLIADNLVQDGATLQMGKLRFPLKVYVGVSSYHNLINMHERRQGLCH